MAEPPSPRHACPWELCGKRFATRGELVQHIRVHTGERPFECSVCSAAFTQRQSLKRHQRIHEDLKPYPCPHEDCTFAARAKSDLDRHMRTHTGELPFACEHPGCGAAFASRASLAKHGHSHAFGRARRGNPSHVKRAWWWLEKRKRDNSTDQVQQEPRACMTTARRVQEANFPILTNCKRQSQIPSANEPAPHLCCPFQTTDIPGSSSSNLS